VEHAPGIASAPLGKHFDLSSDRECTLRRAGLWRASCEQTRATNESAFAKPPARQAADEHRFTQINSQKITKVRTDFAVHLFSCLYLRSSAVDVFLRFHSRPFAFIRGSPLREILLASIRGSYWRPFAVRLCVRFFLLLASYAEPRIADPLTHAFV
jgi:hypothetical protein